MGETSGTAIRALSLGQAARRQRRRLVLGAAGRRRAEGAGRRRTRSTRSRRRSSSSRRRPDVRAAMGAAARELARREHDLDRVAELYVAAFEQAAGGGAVSDDVLARRQPGGGGGRDRARLALRGEHRRAARRGRPRWLTGCGPCPPGPGSLAIVASLVRRSRAVARARTCSARSSWSTSSIYSELAKSFAVRPALRRSRAPGARLRRRLPGADLARRTGSSTAIPTRMPTRRRRSTAS